MPFTFRYLALLKKGNRNVLSSTLSICCLLVGFSWVGNFWNSEGRGKMILKTIKFFPREKQNLSAIYRITLKIKRSKCKHSFGLLELWALSSPFLFCYVKALI